MSILYTNFVLFWLVLNSSLVNTTVFMLWNVKDLILTESKFLSLSSQLCTCTSPLIVHLKYISELLGCWLCLYLSPGAPAYHFEIVLLTTCTACLTECWELPLSGATPQYSQLSISNFCSVPWVQSLYTFPFHLMPFVSSAPQLFRPTLVPVQYLFL